MKARVLITGIYHHEQASSKARLKKNTLLTQTCQIQQSLNIIYGKE
jgi:hypothetical protein